MKRLLNWFLPALLLFAASGAPALAAEALKPGTKAPAFTLTDSEGQEHSLSDFTGKHVVLEWYNPDCPFVKKHYDTDNMQGLQKEFTGKEVVWLLVNSSAKGKQGHCTPEIAEDLRKAKGMHATAILLDHDGAVGRLYGARTTPHMYVIDGEGTLVYNGAIDNRSSAKKADVKGAKNHVRAALNQSMAGEAVATAATQPYGCSVKYAK